MITVWGAYLNISDLTPMLTPMSDPHIAALTREKPAIRDYYDLHYATQYNVIALNNPTLIKLVRKKITLPDTCMVSLDQDKINLLQSRIESELFPTLKQQDLHTFDLESTIDMLNNYYEQLLEVTT